MYKKCLKILKENKGQGLTEYGLILALIAVAVVLSVNRLGNRVFELMDGNVARISQAVDEILKMK